MTAILEHRRSDYWRLRLRIGTVTILGGRESGKESTSGRHILASELGQAGAGLAKKPTPAPLPRHVRHGRLVTLARHPDATRRQAGSVD
jgi:hypothetical protein